MLLKNVTILIFYYLPLYYFINKTNPVFHYDAELITISRFYYFTTLPLNNITTLPPFNHFTNQVVYH